LARSTLMKLIPHPENATGMLPRIARERENSAPMNGSIAVFSSQSVLQLSDESMHLRVISTFPDIYLRTLGLETIVPTRKWIFIRSRKVAVLGRAHPHLRFRWLNLRSDSISGKLIQIMGGGDQSFAFDDGQNGIN
jgi:hypothetical protein